MAGAGYRLFTAGQVLTAAQVNTYLQEQANMVFASAAARDSALSSVKSEGNEAFLLDVNSKTYYTGSGTTWSTLGPVHGALTTWVPVITQSGNVTITNNGSNYTRTGRWIEGSFNVVVTGTGTGTNDITISLPVTAAFPAGLFLPIGTAELLDNSAVSTIVGAIVFATSTTVKIRAASAGARSYVGTAGISAALAANDTLMGTFAYEAAADA